MVVHVRFAHLLCWNSIISFTEHATYKQNKLEDL